MMLKYTLVVTLALLVAVPFVQILSIALPTSPPYTANAIITEISYYSHLKYVISIYNETTVNGTTKMKFLGNYTAIYNVISNYGGTIKVNYTISKIYTTVNSSLFNASNITFLKPGIFNVTLLNDPLCLHYPFIYPGLLYATTYYLYFAANKFDLAMQYINESSVMINNSNYTVYKYENLTTFSDINRYFYVLCNGIEYNFNYTLTYKIENKTHNMYANFILKCLSGNSSTELNFVSNQLEKAFKPYVYLEYTYSSLYAGLAPNTYREIFYPEVFANGYFVYRYSLLNFLAGQPIGQSYFGLELAIGNYANLPITFLVCNSSKIYWECEEFTKVNVTSLNVLGKTYNNVIEYENISSSKSFTLLYFYNGTLIEEEAGNIDGNTYNVTEKVEFVGNSMIPLNITYPNYFDYTNTNLPYNAIGPSLALEISIVVTMIVVALIILLHKRK